MFGIVYGECPHIFATEPKNTLLFFERTRQYKNTSRSPKNGERDDAIYSFTLLTHRADRITAVTGA